MPQLLDTLRWLKIMQLHTTCTRSDAGKQTRIPVHTHMHIATGLQYSLLAVPPGCSCSPRSMEKKGSEQWKAFHLTVGVGDRAQLSHTGSLSRTYTNKHTQEKQKDQAEPGLQRGNKSPKKLFVLKSNNKGYLSQNYFSFYLKLAFFYNYFKDLGILIPLDTCAIIYFLWLSQSHSFCTAHNYLHATFALPSYLNSLNKHHQNIIFIHELKHCSVSINLTAWKCYFSWITTEIWVIHIDHDDSL